MGHTYSIEKSGLDIPNAKNHGNCECRTPNVFHFSLRLYFEKYFATFLAQNTRRNRIYVVRVLFIATLFQKKDGIYVSNVDEEDKNLEVCDAVLTGNTLSTLRTGIRRSPSISSKIIRLQAPPKRR